MNSPNTNHNMKRKQQMSVSSDLGACTTLARAIHGIAAEWPYCMAISTHILLHTRPRFSIRQYPQCSMRMQWS